MAASTTPASGSDRSAVKDGRMSWNWDKSDAEAYVDEAICRIVVVAVR